MSMYTAFDAVTSSIEIFNSTTALYCHDGHCNNVTPAQENGNLTVGDTELDQQGSVYYDIYDDFNEVDNDTYNLTWKHFYDPSTPGISI